MKNKYTYMYIHTCMYIHTYIIDICVYIHIYIYIYSVSDMNICEILTMSRPGFSGVTKVRPFYSKIQGPSYY